MIGWLRNLNEDERRITIEQAAIKCGVPSQAIEKDWWVTLVLKALFQTEYAPHLLFKGGTSLSKCWKLISRFSEDIDLAIDRSLLGFSDNLSRSQIKKLKKNATEFTSTVLKDALIQQLYNLGVPDGIVSVTSEEIKQEQPDKDPQTLFLQYNSLFEPLPYLPSIVKIEISALSLREPFSNCEVRTMLQEYFPNEAYEEEPFIVPAIEPHRTFLEKTFLLHEELARPDKLKTERKSRHFYDLVMLMDGIHGKAALDDMALYETIVQHRKLFYQLSGVDYNTHSQDKINFIPSLLDLNRFESDYAVMREQMIYGESLPFRELIQKLRELRWRFREKLPVPLPPGISITDVIEDARQYAIGQGLLKNQVEGAFISTPVHYNLDISEPVRTTDIIMSYMVSFVISGGKLIPYDIRIFAHK
jgi:predicted nucleotidyltransferase component of viral defense system